MDNRRRGRAGKSCDVREEPAESEVRVVSDHVPKLDLHPTARPCTPSCRDVPYRGIDLQHNSYVVRQGVDFPLPSSVLEW